MGKLNYLIITRPDISFAVNVMNQFVFAPRSTHMETTLRIVRYLNTHLGRGLFYGVHSHLCIEAFTNSDWAASPSVRMSNTRYCIFLGGNLVTWKSQKQIVVA